MTKKTTATDSPAETDDARSADTPEANDRREAMADKAEKGLHKAVEEVEKPEN